MLAQRENFISGILAGNVTKKEVKKKLNRLAYLLQHSPQLSPATRANARQRPLCSAFIGLIF
jgi:hypothetical protein